MRIVPLPADLELAEFEERAMLGPPPSMKSQDCETIDIVRSQVTLPSGAASHTVRALVFASADELARITEAGGHFWVEFIGVTFPPVMFFAPERPDPPDGAEGNDRPDDQKWDHQ